MIDSDDKRTHVGSTSWGMYLDGEVGSIPEGAYPYGLDWEQDPTTGELVSERGHTLCGKLPDGAKLKGFTYDPDKDDLYVAIVLSGGASAIGKVSFLDCTYCEVLGPEKTNCDLGFRGQDSIQMEWKRHGDCQDLKLYWSSDDEYYTYDVGQGLRVEDCESLKMMRCPFMTAPVLSKVEDSGSGLLAGNYMVYARAGDTDANYTNWKGSASTVTLASKSGRAGDRSEDSLRVRISVDTPDYEIVEIAVFDMTNEPSVGRVVAIANAGSSDIDFTYNSRSQYIRDVSLQECETMRPGHVRGRGLVQRGRSLVLYDLRTEINIDYAEQAMNIEPLIEVLRVPLKYAHNFPGLRPGEVYSTYLHWNYCDYTSKKRFHVPGRKQKPEGTLRPCPDCEIPIWRFGGGRVKEGFAENPYEVSESAESTVGGTPDSYDAFVPSQTNVLGPNDASIPDVTEMLESAPSGSDDCECQAHAAAFAAATAGPFPRTGRNIVNRYNDFYNYYLRECRCNGGGTPPGLAAATQPLSAVGVTQEIYNAFLGNMTYEDAVAYHTAVGAGQNYEFERDNDPNPIVSDSVLEQIISTLNNETVESGAGGSTSQATRVDPEPSGSSGEGCGNGGGETPPNAPAGSGGTSTLTNRTDKTPSQQLTGGGAIGDPNWEVTTSEDCDGLPENGSVPNSSGVNPTSSTDDGGFSDSQDNTYGGSVSGTITYTGEIPDIDCEPEVIYAEDGCTVLEVRPCLAALMEPGYFESADHVYPETTKCCGEGKMYGEWAGKPVMYLKIPDREVMPHVVSMSDGVPTANNGGEEEGQDTFVNVFRLRLTNITPPEPDQLAKPLDEANPFTVSIVPRTAVNKSVVASGIAVNTFVGQIQRRDHAFTRLGVNSPEIVDRYIDDGTGFRRGNPEATASAPAAYGFYSPDTLLNRPQLDARWLIPRLNLYGKGHRHGLYADGIEPSSSAIGKENSKGARAAIHLNHVAQLPEGVAPKCVKGQSYAEADEAVSRGDQFTLPLMNKGREATLYVETEGDRIPLTRNNAAADEFSDRSFSGDARTHSCPISLASAAYVDMVRDLPNQYGGIQTQLTNDIHHGTSEDLRSGTVRVAWGDSFVQRFSVKRFSYVSDSVGEDLRPPYEFAGGIRGLRFIGNLLKAIFTDIGAGECGTTPKSGHSEDPRNRVVSGALRDDAGCTTLADYGYTPEGSDKYFPAVQKTLVTFYADSDVATEYRIGADGDPDNAHYRDLAGLSLDSSFPGIGEGFRRSYLDRYDARLSENPKWKMVLRMIFNLLWTYVFGVAMIIYGMSLLANAASRFIAGLSFSILVVIATLLGLGFVILGVFWIITWVNTNHDNRFIDNLLKISDCFPDRRNSSGRFKMFDERVRGFIAGFYKVDTGLLPREGIRTGISIGPNYNVCDCQSERSMDIVESEVQDPASNIDAYRSFRGYRFAVLPMATGRMVKAFTFRGRFYIHTTDALFPIDFEAYRNSAMRGGIPSASAVQYSQGVREGYAGLQDFYSSEVTMQGYVFVDREAGKQFIFDGQNLKVMVPEGANAFADTEIAYGQIGARGSLQCGGPLADEPCGFTLGYDPVGDRMILAKREIGETDDLKGWTISFRPSSESTWRPSSWHTWKPELFIPTRSRLTAYASGAFYVLGDNRSRSMLGNEPVKPHATMVVMPAPSVSVRHKVDTVSVKVLPYERISPLFALRHRWKSAPDNQATDPIKSFMCYGDVQSTGFLDIEYRNEEEMLSRRDGVVTFYKQRPWYRTNLINNRLDNGGDGGAAAHPGYADLTASLFQSVNTDNTDTKRQLEVTWLAIAMSFPEDTFVRLSQVAIKSESTFR